VVASTNVNVTVRLSSSKLVAIKRGWFFATQ